MNCSDERILVAINCIAYNHEPYIRECLEGFVMQKTNFKFVAIVHDDASTDKTADIIREYEAKYPEIIKPIYETENQYSKKDGSLRRIMNAAVEATGAKYVAMCEGDDYWTDPYKLQKQVDFLEEHEECQMCCSDAVILTSNGEQSWKRYEENCIVPIEDIIIGGGWWLQTTTYVYRKSLLSDKEYPDCCRRCHVGDYPLMIWAALNGGVGYISDITAVYRYMCEGSWTAKHEQIQKKISDWRSEINMLNGLDTWSKYRYTNVFKEKIVDFLYDHIILCHKGNVNEILIEFRLEMRLLKKKQRFHVFFIKNNKENWYEWLMKRVCMIRQMKNNIKK